LGTRLYTQGHLGNRESKREKLWSAIGGTDDLRRTCARLCHQAGGELDQIQFLLGHVSIQTTERYLGCKQRFHDAVNDHIGLEPDAPS
jgi:integrase